jgi:hypothetical protein
MRNASGVFCRASDGCESEGAECAAFSSMLVNQPKKPLMNLRKFGAISAFILTFQFLATLWLLYVAWPQGVPLGWAGLQQLPDSIATYIAEMAGRPTPFLLTNLYNAVFTAPAIVLAVALREHIAAAPNRMLLAVIGASIAGGLWLAGGIIPCGVCAADHGGE